MKRKKIKLPLILIILILVVSVGYALLTSEGSIHGWSMLADSKWDIHFTNLVVNEGSTDLSEEDSAAVITEDNTQVTYRVTLNKPGDFYEFTVDVKNFGTIDGMVNLLTSTMSIDGEDSVEIAEDKSNLPEYLDYSITYNDGTKIDKNHELKAGEYETYRVRVEFKKDITADQLPTEVKTILFNITPEFVQANDQAIEREKPSPFITRVSTEGLGIMSYDIDYDKCVEEFSYIDDVDAYCHGEDVNDNGYIYNIKQDIGYDGSYYEDLGIITNIKYGELESYEINHDGCTNYLRNNGEENEEQIELFCTGNTATIFGQEINLREIINAQPEYASMYETIGLININYVEANPNRIITGYDGEIPKNLVIPKTINGSTVIGIEESAFENQEIESVSIPNTVEFIGRKAFNENNLRTVTLGDNNTELGNCAFGKKESITTNNLPENYYCEIIYWALQDNDNDNTNETLVISDSEVVGKKQGDFDGDTTFSWTDSIPWIKASGFTNIENNRNLSYNVSNVKIEGSPKPKSTAYWFYGVGYNASTFNANLENLDTSEVTDMSEMFILSGNQANTYNLNLSNWNTSQVTNMYHMFGGNLLGEDGAGYHAQTFNLDLSNWDTSNVTDMSYMFNRVGYLATTWSIGDLSDWNTSKVTNMHSMFASAGRNATAFNLDLSNWDTSNVTDMSSMFGNYDQRGSAGQNATIWNIGNLSNWDTSNVTDMSEMFDSAGNSATIWDIGNLSNWDTSRVIDMRDMFAAAGEDATTWNIGNLSNWDTSNVTDMRRMFYWAGRKATTWNIGDLGNWDTSKVINMASMFNHTAYNSTTWSIGNLSNWNTSNVTHMGGMFEDTGGQDTTFNLNLSNWDTSNVTDMNFMFYGTGRKATTWSIGDLGNWDTSKVTNMSGMFGSAGYNATVFDISYIDNWDTSKVTNISSMFDQTAYNSTTWSIGNLSNWDTSNVTDMNYMFEYAGYNATTFNLDLSNWDTSKVTYMNYMFRYAGYNTTVFKLDLGGWNTSKVTTMSGMFSEVGKNATTWSITIPRTNGNGIDNTVFKMYGSTTSIYISNPYTNNRFFTLASN